MKVKITTESGSKYILDDVAMTWQRTRGEGAAVIRTESGQLKVFPEIELGQRCILLGPPLAEIDDGFSEFGVCGRMIMTTPVKEAMFSNEGFSDEGPQVGICIDCGHSLEDNAHGVDQNDLGMDGDTLRHNGICTYCKLCFIVDL